LIRYGIAIEPIRKYIFGEAATPFIELPNPAFTSGCSPVSTRMIVALSPSSGIASRTIASMCRRAPRRPTHPEETSSWPGSQAPVDVDSFEAGAALATEAPASKAQKSAAAVRTVTSGARRSLINPPKYQIVKGLYP
jgi:hypothetical protein